MLAEVALLLALTLPPLAPMPDVAPVANRTALKWALTSYMAASAVDRASTGYWVGSGRAQEVGALRGFSSDPVGLTVLGASLDVTSALILWRVGKAHPKAATWTAVALTAFKVGIVVRNSRTVR